MIADIVAKVKLFVNYPCIFPVLSFFFMVGLFPTPGNAFDILLGAGETGSFSHFVGKSMCRAVNQRASEINCIVVPSEDEVHTITNLQGGSLDICLIDSHTIYNAVNRKENFKYLGIRYDNLSSLQHMYDIPVTLVVRKDAGIASLDEMKGKRINAGRPGSSQRRMVQAILDAKGWTRVDFSLMEELPESQSQAGMAFCHGTIQAMMHIGVHPDPSIQQLFELCKADLAGMNDGDIHKLINRQPAFIRTTIHPGTYPNQSDAITTLGTHMMLVSSKDLDEETAYRIMEALYLSKEQLKKAHPALLDFSDKVGDDPDIGLERHPGAVRFFSQN